MFVRVSWIAAHARSMERFLLDGVLEPGNLTLPPEILNAWI